MTSHECDQCTYVGHPDFIVVPESAAERTVLSFGQAVRALFGLVSRQDLIIPLGRFTMPGWPEHSTWYLFECAFCEALKKNYPQRYARGGLIKLPCPDCDGYLALAQRRFYEADGLAIPVALMTRREREEFRRQERARV